MSVFPPIQINLELAIPEHRDGEGGDGGGWDWDGEHM